MIWLWIVSNIAVSLLSAATTAWFKDTKAGKWCFDRYLAIVYWANEKYGLDILDKEEISWRQKYPKMETRIIKIESRILDLENKLKKKK